MFVNPLTRALFVALFAFPLAIAEGQNLCKAADARLTAPMRERIVGIVTGVGATADKRRASTELPQIPADSVFFVADSATCAAAAAAYASLNAASTPPTVLPVWVLRVGATRFVVFNPERFLDDIRTVAVYDEQFTFKIGIYIGP